VQPGGGRPGIAAGDDLDLIAIVEPVPELHHAAVDLGPHTMVADLGMDGIGEIDRRGAARQRFQVAARREAEDLVLEHRELGVREELLGLGRVLQDVEKLADPAILAAGGDPALLLVGPVRRDPELGHLVHLPGLDLHPRSCAARARGWSCAASGSRSASASR
jgi:hypothetical protein